VVYRLLKSLKIALIYGLLAALSITSRPLILSGHKPVEWAPVLATAGRAFAIYTAVIFLLVFTGILKPRSKASETVNVNPWFWGIVGVVAVAVAVWALT
jgi:hypothetical protein